MIGVVDVFSSKLLDQLPPVLRTLLLSDGTVTKFLEAYYRERIQVKTLVHEEVPLGEDMAPLEIKKGELILSRRVQMLGATTNRLYGMAESFIRADILWPDARGDLIQGRLGIGELMRERRVETYRELLDWDSGSAGRWAVELGCSEDAATVARTYRIFVAGRPCLLITDRYVIAHFA
jgi:chorismate-pyruvate lyase